MPENFSAILEEIRRENILDWGRKIETIGDFLANELYSDRTHFIYELLQNAEDAFGRANIKGINGKYKIEFSLFKDRLEVRHNGIPFDINDVKGVCSILAGTKSEDITQIGKFGIGFKSVYAFTKSPEIYSEEKSFRIDKYVLPVPLEPRTDLKPGETLIVIPFNNIQVSNETAFSEIEERLKNLGLRTPLFLQNSSEISWSLNNSTGTYQKGITYQENAKKVELLYFENNELKKEENWLVFERPLNEDPKRKVEVAFQIQKNKNTNKNEIIPTYDTCAVVYFPTIIATNLKFLIQAPFDPTPSRDNIKKTELNKQLVNELAILTADTISNIKKMGLLDYNFLNTLPVEKWRFDQSYFHPIFQSVKEKLLGEQELLPTFNNDFTTAKNGLLARGEKLRELLSSDQLCILFKREQAIWLDENITVDRTPDLRKYFLEELQIEEIDSDRLAKEFNKEFIEQQSDEWLIKFYSYLNNQESLWRKEAFFSNKLEGPLRSKPIIRCEDGTHVAPFKPNGNAAVFLPTDEETNKYFCTVKKDLVKTEASKEFLTKLGLNKPDKIIVIIEKILPLYSGSEKKEISDETHLNQVVWIAETLSEIGNPSIKGEITRKEDLLSRVKSTPFLYGRNNVTSEIQLKRPWELYLDKHYTENEDAEIFLEGNANIWILDERYMKISSLNIDFFKLIGCKIGIQVQCRPALYGSTNEYNILINSHGYHLRGWYGFDPFCDIEGLDHCLRTITIKKSIIIWNLLKIHYDKISGRAEFSTHKNFSPSENQNDSPSKMGGLLKTHAWLSDKNGTFSKPSDIQLMDLSDDFDKTGHQSIHIAEKLDFKRPTTPWYEQVPEYKTHKELIEEYEKLPPEEKQKILDAIKKCNTPPIRTEPPTASEILGCLQDSTVREGQSNNESETLSKPDLTPEEEDSLRQNYGEELPKRLKRLKSVINSKLHQKIKITDTIDPQAFLNDQYHGHCQICNTKLDFGLNKSRPFVTHRITKTKNIHEWADMEFNVLCLCPNCHALMDHGTPWNLQNIFSIAENVTNHDIAPEEIPERNGSYYIVKILVAGKEKILYYSLTHMQKVSAFLENTKEK